jgi:asparagine synthase (glutamine-hydrolysing)
MPYADHRLVEYVHNAMKACDATEQRMLRQAAAAILPWQARPSGASPGYNAELQRQAKVVLADRDHLAMSLIDWDWLADAIAVDPATMAPDLTGGLDWVLDLYHWTDLHNPTIVRPE